MLSTLRERQEPEEEEEEKSPWGQVGRSFTRRRGRQQGSWPPENHTPPSAPDSFTNLLITPATTIKERARKMKNHVV
jgi:hypothetical protein